MATIRSRLPSKNDVLLTFAAIVFPIHLQAFIGWMILVPSLIKRYTLWDTLGVVSYMHVFALMESMALLFVMVLLAIMLPEKYYRSQFTAVSTMFVFLTVPFAYIVNLFLITGSINMRLLIVLLVFGILFGFLYILITRYEKISKFFINLTSLLSVLSVFYVFVDVIAVIVLIVRKLGI